MYRITHSLCTMEFEAHRPLYDWVVGKLPVPCTPRQIEFSRLNLQYTVLSKRRLIQLVRRYRAVSLPRKFLMRLIQLARRYRLQ